MEDTLVALLKKLIAIPSITGDIPATMQALELIKTELKNYHYKSFVSENFPSLLFYNTDQQPNHFTIILNAHIDVVPGTSSQFMPYEKDGKIYGRGAYDMKSATAVMIVLFNELAKKVSYPLGLQITPDEETTGANGTGYQIKQGVMCDFAIMGEGTNFKIVHQAKGRLILKLQTKGFSVHSAYPWLGKNAINYMYFVIDTLYKRFPHPERETHNTTFALTHIETTNKAHNKVPDSCTAVLDFRFSQADEQDLVQSIVGALPDVFSHEILLNHENAMHTDPNSPYIRLLQDAGENVLPHTLPITSAHGTSDARFFTDAGIDAIEFGPIGHGQHQDNEWVDIQSLTDYYTILKTFLLSLK